MNWGAGFLAMFLSALPMGVFNPRIGFAYMTVVVCIVLYRLGPDKTEMLVKALFP